MIPWNDRSGRFSPLKALVFCGVLAPALWLAWRAGFDMLGPRPWVEAAHRTGDWALRFLFLSLAVTPVRMIFRAPQVMAVRRMLGLAALAYALSHVGLYVADMAFDLPKVAAEIVLRIYLTVGFVVVLGLVALGVTSTDGMIRRLGGRRWRALHRLVYPLAALGTLHFFMQSKLDVGEATLMAGALVWLLGVRVLPKFDAVTPVGLAVAAVAAAAVTAGIEALWIGLKAGAPMLMILAANFDPGLGPRPAWWILAAGSAVAAAARMKPSRDERSGRAEKPAPPCACPTGKTALRRDVG